MSGDSNLASAASAPPPKRGKAGALFTRFGEWCQRSPWVALAPWLGTLIASWLVGWSQGNIWLIGAGALIAFIGCFPVAAERHASEFRRRRSVDQDTRERRALQYVAALMQRVGDLGAMVHSARVKERDNVVADVPSYLLEKVFNSDQAIRVSVYTVNADTSSLELAKSKGRTAPRGRFDLSTRDGQAIFDELVEEPHVFNPHVIGKEYVAYLAAPILYGQQLFGMLTVDSAAPGVLDGNDGYAIEVIALALAPYFVHAEAEPEKSVRALDCIKELGRQIWRVSD